MKNEKGERPGRPKRKYIGVDLDAKVFDEIDELAEIDHRTFSGMLRVIIDLGLVTYKKTYPGHERVVDNLIAQARPDGKLQNSHDTRGVILRNRKVSPEE